jgi:hypothetical protein
MGNSSLFGGGPMAGDAMAAWGCGVAGWLTTLLAP